MSSPGTDRTLSYLQSRLSLLDTVLDRLFSLSSPDSTLLREKLERFETLVASIPVTVSGTAPGRALVLQYRQKVVDYWTRFAQAESALTQCRLGRRLALLERTLSRLLTGNQTTPPNVDLLERGLAKLSGTILQIPCARSDLRRFWNDRVITLWTQFDALLSDSSESSSRSSSSSSSSPSSPEEMINQSEEPKMIQESPPTPAKVTSPAETPDQDLKHRQEASLVLGQLEESITWLSAVPTTGDALEQLTDLLAYATDTSRQLATVTLSTAEHCRLFNLTFRKLSTSHQRAFLRQYGPGTATNRWHNLATYLHQLIVQLS